MFSKLIEDDKEIINFDFGDTPDKLKDKYMDVFNEEEIVRGNSF